MITWSMFYWPLALPLGALLDMYCGDPAWLPHPVRWIGRWAAWCEKAVRVILGGGIIAGIVFWILVVGTTALVTVGVLVGSYHIDPALCHIWQVWLVYQGLAMRDLDREVRKIAGHLLKHDLDAARLATARIVSRNTQGMDEAALSRSAIESAAENGVDGVLSPMFWTFIGGPCGLWIFKAVSTLDSMVGYRTPEYEKFGKCAARVDDVFNWIPARLSLLLYAWAARLNGKKALYIGRRDHALHESPNSGYGEATMAGCLEVRLGGPAVYHGVLKDKPWLGAEFRDPNGDDVYRCLNTLWGAATWMLLLCVFVSVVLFLCL